MLTRVSEERLRGIPQMEVVQQQLLEDALEFLQGFAPQAGDDPQLRAETAMAYRRLARSYSWLGQNPEAEQCLAEAAALQEQLAADSAKTRRKPASDEYHSRS